MLHPQKYNYTISTTQDRNIYYIECEATRRGGYVRRVTGGWIWSVEAFRPAQEALSFPGKTLYATRIRATMGLLDDLRRF